MPHLNYLSYEHSRSIYYAKYQHENCLSANRFRYRIITLNIVYILSYYLTRKFVNSNELGNRLITNDGNVRNIPPIRYLLLISEISCDANVAKSLIAGLLIIRGNDTWRGGSSWSSGRPRYIQIALLDALRPGNSSYWSRLFYLHLVVVFVVVYA